MAVTKVRKKPFPWSTIIIVTVFAWFFILHLARVEYDNPDANVAEILELYVPAILRSPFDFIYLGSTKWVWSAFLAMGYFIGIIYIYLDYEGNKRVFSGKEKGTAQWNDFIKYTKDYAYPKGEKGHREPPEGSNDLGNLILAKQTYLNLNINETFKNDNVFVLGSTGTGKTRYYVKPNILQQNTSFIITDPSGELLTDVGDSLMRAGYVVKVFNLFEMDHSCGYNPFEYITSDSDIPILVDCFVKNTTDAKAGKGDQFFDQAMVQLFTALFYYIYYEVPKEERTMGKVVDLLTLMKVDENNPNAKSRLDIMFDDYEKKDPEATAVTNYKMFRVGAGKTLKSIIISANVRMRPFTLGAVRDLTSRDTIRLNEIGDHKQAIFIITPTQIKTYNFLAAMMYTQLFMIMFNKGSNDCKNRYMVKWDASSPIQSKTFSNGREKKEFLKAFEERVEIYRNAQIVEEERTGLSEEDIEKIGKYRYIIKDTDGNTLTFGTEDGAPAIFECREQAKYFMRCIKNGKIMPGNIRLPSHVHMVLDEFANIGLIPEFDQIIATMRKFSISCTLILQSRAQLKELYKDNADTLVSNCSTTLFLGTTSYDDAEWLSKKLGKATQVVKNSSKSFGSKGNESISKNKDSIDLMTPDEVLRKPSEDCIIQIEGLDPFYDKKYPLYDHPNSGQLADDKTGKNLFAYKVYFVTGTRTKSKEQTEGTTDAIKGMSTPMENKAQAERIAAAAGVDPKSKTDPSVISALIKRNQASPLSGSVTSPGLEIPREAIMKTYSRKASAVKVQTTTKLDADGYPIFGGAPVPPEKPQSSPLPFG